MRGPRALNLDEGLEENVVPAVVLATTMACKRTGAAQGYSATKEDDL
jgi:hypothetical protein